jgi:hypothetical protein
MTLGINFPTHEIWGHIQFIEPKNGGQHVHDKKYAAKCHFPSILNTHLGQERLEQIYGDYFLQDLDIH